MSDRSLDGKLVVILVANGFDETEFTEPQRRLIQAGATVKVASRANGLVNGWYENSWGHFFPVDADLAETLAIDYDGLIVPGGSRGLEKLMDDAHARRIVAAFMRENMPVLLLSDATRMLVATENAAGRTITSDQEGRAELETAGAVLQDSNAIADNQLVTGTGGEHTVEAFDMFKDLVAAFEREITEAA
jgi:protease I